MRFSYLWIKHLFHHFNIIAMIILVYETIQSIVLSPVPPLNKTQLFGQLIPWSWSLTLVGKQFRQVLHKRFLTFSGAWIFQIRSLLPSTMWTLISSCWSRLICYQFLSEYTLGFKVPNSRHFDQTQKQEFEGCALNLYYLPNFELLLCSTL